MTGLLNKNKSKMGKDINVIVAAGKHGEIGRAGDLIWHISADLKRFKALTTGHPVVMGRKTWESLPKRPLPGRTNIVVSRNQSFEAPGGVVVSSPEEALRQAQSENGGDSVFIMGGAQLYNAFFPLATRIYLTEIDAECSDANAFIPYPLNPDEWQLTEITEAATTPDNVTYRYATYERRE